MRNETMINMTVRYHALDALRAAMMLLGLVLHSAVSYQVEPLYAVWPYKDHSTSRVFDVVFVIHVFRMPVFFVAAGFFSALLMQREGPLAFLRHRARRLLAPLVVFWPIVFPLVAAGFIFANTHAAGRADMALLTSGAFLRTANLSHLWFIWILMIFTILASALVAIGGWVSDTVDRRIDVVFGRIATTMSGMMGMALITTMTLLPMRTNGLDTSVALLPAPRVLIAYGVFFTFGWMLYRRRDVLDRLAAQWALPLTLGILACGVYLSITVANVLPNPLTAKLGGSLAAAIAMWMLIAGLIGLFVAKLGQPHPIVRYLADASYWMYIVHLPFAIGFPALMARWAVPAIVKFGITLSATLAITLVTYHYLVRATAIGAFLNGRRYRRELPTAETIQATA